MSRRKATRSSAQDRASSIRSSLDCGLLEESPWSSDQLSIDRPRWRRSPIEGRDGRLRSQRCGTRRWWTAKPARAGADSGKCRASVYHLQDAAKGQVVRDFVQFVITQGQNWAEQLEYAKLPSSLAEQDQKLSGELQGGQQTSQNQSHP